VSWDPGAVAVVSGVRTAVGRFGGGLKDVEAHELAAICIAEAAARAGVRPDEIDEVVLGQVAQAGPDAYNARRAAIAAGIPTGATAMNVNRLCSSGLQAIVTAAREVASGDVRIAAAGGNESLSRVDGMETILTDPWNGILMGGTAENVAERHGVSRESQDAFALESQRRAAAAIAAGHFDREIVPVETNGGVVDRDEHVRPETTAEKLAGLKPVFRESGSVTAGNSSGINDGAAAVILMGTDEAERRGLEPRLHLRSWAVSGVDPEVMGYAPTYAIPKALERAGLELDDVDVIELNEAFAAQAVAVARDLDLDPEKVNPSGGAIALGHPIGASGARIVGALIHELRRRGGGLGCAAICSGGGQGDAIILEVNGQ
jgi:acetyl-CoA C-acetyltransferase